MRIVYATKNSNSSILSAKRICENLSLQNHIVRIASYSAASCHFDSFSWCLDCLYIEESPRVKTKAEVGMTTKSCNLERLKLLIKQIEEFAPDLIISDGPSTIVDIGLKLGINIIYCCSSLVTNYYKFNYNRHYHILDRHRTNCMKGFVPEHTIIYSPFVDAAELNESGNLFATPYYKSTVNINSSYNIYFDSKDRLDNFRKYNNHNVYNFVFNESWEDSFSTSKSVLFGGETDYLADCLYNGISFSISPDLNDLDAVINSNLCELLNFGKSIGKIDADMKYLIDYTDDELKNDSENNIKLNKNHIQVHEIINELFS